MGTDLNPAALQHIAGLVHIFLAFQIGQDFTKDRFDTTERKHAVSLLSSSLTCLLLFPELRVLLRQWNVGWKKRERRTKSACRTCSVQRLRVCCHCWVCGRGGLKHPWAFLLGDLWRQHSLALAKCHCVSAYGKNSSNLESTKMQCMCSGMRQLSLMVWPDPPESLQGDWWVFSGRESFITRSAGMERLREVGSGKSSCLDVLWVLFDINKVKTMYLMEKNRPQPTQKNPTKAWTDHLLELA